MSEEIKKGDLCIVVKPTICCNSPRFIGRIVRILGPVDVARGKCAVCGIVFAINDNHLLHAKGRSIDKRRLKKINPPAIEDSETAVREVTA